MSETFYGSRVIFFRCYWVTILQIGYYYDVLSSCVERSDGQIHEAISKPLSRQEK